MKNKKKMKQAGPTKTTKKYQQQKWQNDKTKKKHLKKQEKKLKLKL